MNLMLLLDVWDNVIWFIQMMNPMIKGDGVGFWMLVCEVLKSQGSSFCSAEKGKMICVHESFDGSTTLVMTESSGKRWKRIEKEKLMSGKEILSWRTNMR